MATVLPYFLPGLGLSIVLAFAFGQRVARRLRTSWAAAGLLIISVGAVLAATIPPDRGPLGWAGHTGCDLGRIGLAPMGAYLRITDTSLNVALFIPLGLAVGLLPSGSISRRGWLIAVALPFAIELVQLIVPVLGRGCQSADVVDNLLGLAIGGALASLFKVVRPSARARQ